MEWLEEERVGEVKGGSLNDGRSRTGAARGKEPGIANSVEGRQRERLRLQVGCWASYILSSTSFGTLVGVQQARA